MDDRIYLDAAATSRPEKAVLDDIIKSLDEDWHNPSSVYSSGMDVRRKIEKAREQVRNFIGADEKDAIIFTSCATESNNLAVQGFIKACQPGKALLLYDWMQHPSLENIKEFIERHDKKAKYGYGMNCGWMPVFSDEYGRMKLSSLELYLERLRMKSSALYPDGIKVLVPVIHTNNETGVRNNIKSITELVHSYGGYVLVDASQTVYHSPINVRKLGIDMMSFTFEKMGGIRGCGVLYVKDGISIEPLMYGGGQEGSMRSGTENQSAIIALGNQCERLSAELSRRLTYEIELENLMIQAIKDACKGVCEYRFNFMGDEEVDVATNILSVCFYGYGNQQLLTLLDEYGVECSAGSACSSGESKPSRVLISAGMSEEEAKSTLRFSFDWRLTDDEVKRFGKILKKCLIALKQ